MSQTIHTPTPYLHEPMTLVVTNAERRVILEVLPYHKGPAFNDEETQATCDFVTRACNAHAKLLAACKVVTRVAENALDSVDFPAQILLQDILGEMGPAIAKAEAREPVAKGGVA